MRTLVVLATCLWITRVDRARPLQAPPTPVIVMPAPEIQPAPVLGWNRYCVSTCGLAVSNGQCDYYCLWNNAWPAGSTSTP